MADAEAEKIAARKAKQQEMLKRARENMAKVRVGGCHAKPTGARLSSLARALSLSLSLSLSLMRTLQLGRALRCMQYDAVYSPWLGAPCVSQR